MFGIFVAVLVVLTPLLVGDSPHDPDRRAELNRLLDQAIALNASNSRTREHDSLPAEPSADEVDLDLAHMELMGGYLEKTCIYKNGEVRELRRLMIYIDLMRLVGVPDAEIKSRLVERAGPHADALSALLDFAGLDGLSHFICLDYMRARLREGMHAEDLRDYVQQVSIRTNSPPIPSP